MLKTKTITKVYRRCDFCGRKIKPKKVECETCGEAHDIIPIYTTKVWNTRKLFPEMCLRCAQNLDKALKQMQDDLTECERIILRNKALNDARREELDTKG